MRAYRSGGDEILAEEAGTLGMSDCNRLSTSLHAIGFWSKGETDSASAATLDGEIFVIEAYEPVRGYHREWHQVGYDLDFDRAALFADFLIWRNHRLSFLQQHVK